MMVTEGSPPPPQPRWPEDWEWDVWSVHLPLPGHHLCAGRVLRVAVFADAGVFAGDDVSAGAFVLI